MRNGPAKRDTKTLKKSSVAGRTPQFPKEPGPGEGPITLGRARGNSHYVPGLFIGHSGEEPQLDQLCGLLVFLLEFFKSFVDQEQRFWIGQNRYFETIQTHAV